MLNPQNTSALKQQKIAYQQVAVTIRPGLTFEEWQSACQAVQQMTFSHQWWIGDLLNYGEENYGEKYAQAINVGSMGAKQTLKNYCHIASQIPPKVRRPGVSFTCHRELAAMDTKEQIEWLDKIEEGDWSSKRLKDEIKQNKIEIVQKGPDPVGTDNDKVVPPGVRLDEETGVDAEAITDGSMEHDEATDGRTDSNLDESEMAAARRLLGDRGLGFVKDFWIFEGIVFTTDECEQLDEWMEKLREVVAGASS